MNWQKFYFMKSARRSLRLLVLAGLILAIQAGAMAVTIVFTSPANNSHVKVGDKVAVTVHAYGSGYGFTSIVMGYPDGTGEIASYGASDFVMDTTEVFNKYTVPANKIGQTLTYSVTLNDSLDDPAHATLHLIVDGEDKAAPTYTGAAGVKTAVRKTRNVSADLTWAAATDDVSAADKIVYSVYYATSAAEVFTGAAKATFTGTTAGLITGLDREATYYFGVRAQDEAGNQEKNTTVSAALEPLPNAVPATSWSLYE